MSRSTFLELAALHHRVPLAVDLVLKKYPDWQKILLDGDKLGRVIAEAATEFATPVAFPLMDLTVEKARLCTFFDVPLDEADRYQLEEPPSRADIERFAQQLPLTRPSKRVAANLAALRYVATQTALIPVGMMIGPFSLTSKLLMDPITPVFLAGTGVNADEEPEVALVEAALQLAQLILMQTVREQIEAGASAIFVAEPAANKIFFSPNQIAQGSDVFDHFVLEPNRRLAALMAEHDVDLLFHCCGELIDEMIDGFVSLHPALLSLGSSRRLWEDAARIPDDIVLYGNLPSKQFYSDRVLPPTKLQRVALELIDQMNASGHPFILGTECDTLHVDGCAETIRAKVAQLLHFPPVVQARL